MSQLIVRQLGIQSYEPVWRAMQSFTESRDRDTNDEIWLLQHHPVFTLGMNGKPEHVLNQGNIPLVNIDRGGQVTYHGPGQIIAYFMLDLKRHGWGVRQMVTAMEQAVIELLQQNKINAQARKDAPGVYVDEAKIAALGLRVKKGCSYHGLSLNVDMDLSPFSQINPCGYENLAVTDCKSLGIKYTIDELQQQLLGCLLDVFEYNDHQLLIKDHIE